MNKKYTDFETEAPNSARIILHADPSTGELKKTTFGNFLPPLVLCLTISQSGTNPPTIEFINSTTYSVSVSRTGTGSYTLAVDIPDSPLHLIPVFSNANNLSSLRFVFSERLSALEYAFYVTDLSGTLVDDWDSLGVALSFDY